MEVSHSEYVGCIRSSSEARGWSERSSKVREVRLKSGFERGTKAAAEDEATFSQAIPHSSRKSVSKELVWIMSSMPLLRSSLRRCMSCFSAMTVMSPSTFL